MHELKRDNGEHDQQRGTDDVLCEGHFDLSVSDKLKVGRPPDAQEETETARLPHGTVGTRWTLG
jgi:hypothetical protein